MQNVDDDEADDQRERRHHLEIDQRLDADPADLLEVLHSGDAMTTVQKMIGAISILISLMKASPNGFICSPSAG